MRKLLLLSVYVLAATLCGAVPFSIDREIETKRYSMWDSILSEHTLLVSLELLGNLPREDEAEYRSLIRSGINSWFTDAARFIKEAKREEEFADILPVLEQQIRVEFRKTGEEFWNFLVFVFDDMQRLRKSCRSEHVLACAKDASSVAFPSIHIFSLELAAEEELNWEGVFVHEFGHLLGLNDQYPLGVQTQRDRHASGMKSSTIYPEDTVMYDSMNEIGCDDVDGLINIIDLRRGGAQGKRKDTAWKSFCEQSNDYFKDGKRIE